MSDTESSEGLYRSLGRMEGKLDALVTAFALQASRQTDIEKRVAIVERFQSRITGMAVGGAALVSAAITYITKFLPGAAP